MKFVYDSMLYSRYINHHNQRLANDNNQQRRGRRNINNNENKNQQELYQLISKNHQNAIAANKAYQLEKLRRKKIGNINN
jgi:hypothetical protein